MSRHHLVRVGALGRVGRFTAVDAVSFPRGTRVICRTARGLEVGEVLGPTPYDPDRWQSDGSILRGMTVADDLLLARQQKNRDEAFHACRELLAERGSMAVLMDVEQLFDAGTLYFYFLGEVSAEDERLTAELAEAYDSKVAFRQFAETVAVGCGPGCGTEEAAGFCGTTGGACVSCGVAGACGTKKLKPSGNTMSGTGVSPVTN
jgi:cell fate regulator YaaT (PSP1 superfamily)